MRKNEILLIIIDEDIYGNNQGIMMKSNEMLNPFQMVFLLAGIFASTVHRA